MLTAKAEKQQHSPPGEENWVGGRGPHTSTRGPLPWSGEGERGKSSLGRLSPHMDGSGRERGLSLGRTQGATGSLSPLLSFPEG